MDFDGTSSTSGDIGGGEVSEVESRDSDYGDGDGVNDFDATYNEMNSGNETLDYDDGTDGDETAAETEEDDFDTTNDVMEDELDGFDDSSDAEATQEKRAEQEVGDNVEQSSGMNTDESVDDALSEFDDSAEDGESVESDEVESENETDETKEQPEDVGETKAEENDDMSAYKAEDVSEESSDDEVKKNEISENLDEALSKFDQETWDNLTPEEQKEAITDLRDAVAEDLQLSDKPEVKFYNVEDSTDFGGYSARENAIYINEYNMGDALETADTIAHESRHCWQHERAANPQNEQDLIFRENFRDYVSPSDDYQEYKDQPVERDAREYASNVCDNIRKSDGSNV